MESDKIWKLRHTIIKDGIISFDAMVNYDDKFKAEMELLRMKETDIIRRDNTEEFEYKDVDGVGVESWKYSCKEYSREVLVYPVEI